MFGLMKRTTHDQVTRDLQSIIRSKDTRITQLIKECNETAGELVWSEAKVKEQAGRMERAEKDVLYKDNVIKSKNTALNNRDATINKYRADNTKLNKRIENYRQRIYNLQARLKTEKKRSASYKGHVNRLTKKR